MPLKATFTPQQLNLLIQCAELNLKYTEGLAEHFDFSSANPAPASEDSSAGTEIAVHIPSIICSLHDWTDAWFFLAQVSDIDLAAELYSSSRKVLRISAKQVAVFDRNAEKEKAVAIHHKENNMFQDNSMEFNMCSLILNRGNRRGAGN